MLRTIWSAPGLPCHAFAVWPAAYPKAKRSEKPPHLGSSPRTTRHGIRPQEMKFEKSSAGFWEPVRSRRRTPRCQSPISTVENSCTSNISIPNGEAAAESGRYVGLTLGAHSPVRALEVGPQNVPANRKVKRPVNERHAN
jgi:hypothetical protein